MTIHPTDHKPAWHYGGDCGRTWCDTCGFDAQPFTCILCGEIADDATVSHGSMAVPMHVPMKNADGLTLTFYQEREATGPRGQTLHAVVHKQGTQRPPVALCGADVTGMGRRNDPPVALLGDCCSTLVSEILDRASGLILDDLASIVDALPSTDAQ